MMITLNANNTLPPTILTVRALPINIAQVPLWPFMLLAIFSLFGCRTLSQQFEPNLYCEDVVEHSTPPGIARRLVGMWREEGNGETIDQNALEFVKLDAGSFSICAQGIDDRFWCWGRRSGPKPMGTSNARYRTFATGVDTLCAVDDSYQLQCWFFREGVRRIHFERRTFLEIGYGMFVWTGLTTDGQIDDFFADNTRTTYQVDNPGYTINEFDSGSHFACWIVSDDLSLECDNTLINETKPGGKFHGLSCTDTYCCALNAMNEVQCFGPTGLMDDERILDTPDGEFISVSAGLRHACGLDKRGRVTCWGANDHGQANAPRGKFTQISAGGFFTCALDTKNHLYCWGHQYSFCINPTSPPAH